jgi:hypothetical protein
MPASIQNADRRRRLRKELKDYMDPNKVSCREIAAYITAQPPEAFGGISMSSDTVRNFLDEEAGKVGNKYVDAIERFLKRQANGQDSPPLPTSFFTAAASFFRMVPAKAEQYCGSILGSYAFHAHSETERPKVSRGALSFTRVDGALCVSERQETIPPGSTKPHREFYSGHFLFRKDTVIAMLSEQGHQGHQGRALPKFYILSITGPTDDEGKKLIMCGVMMKLGEDKSIFTSYVHLTRSETALNECAVIPRREVPDDILGYLDGDMWE